LFNPKKNHLTTKFGGLYTSLAAFLQRPQAVLKSAQSLYYIFKSVMSN